MFETSELDTDAQQRASTLVAALSDQGVVIPSDSELCREYILYGEQAKVPILHIVVKKMCESKYLHEYCNFDLGYSMAKGIITFHIGNAVAQKKWMEMVRKCVLLTTGSTKFPRTWPWLQNVSARAWKAKHDRTLSLVDPIVPDIYFRHQ
jgi:hypothetical protein